MKNNINIVLVLMFNILFLTVPASGKTQLPGVAGTINSSDYIDNRLVIENNHSISIYDVEKQEMLSTHNFYYSDKYAATRDNYYLLNDEDETEIIVFNIYSPQDKDTIKTSNRLDSVEIEGLLFFSINEILIKTKNGVYLYSEENNKIELIFNYEGNLVRSKNNYRLFLSGKKVYFINKDNDVITYELKDNIDFIDFNIVNEHLVYNIPAKGQEPPKLISLNLNTNEIINIKVLDALLKEVSISNNEILLFKDGYRGILEKFDHKLNKRGSIKIDDITLIDIIEPLGNNKYIFLSTLEYQIYKFNENEGELRDFTFFNTMLVNLKLSNDKKLLCGISIFNDKILKIIDISEKKVLFNLNLKYKVYGSYNNIFYTDEYGFLFQYEENSIINVNPDKNFEIENEVFFDGDIISFHYENSKLYVLFENTIEIYQGLKKELIETIEFEFTPVKMLVNKGQIYIAKDPGEDEDDIFYKVDKDSYDLEEYHTIGRYFYREYDYGPKISFSENNIFFADEDLYVVGKNVYDRATRIVMGEKANFVIAINDSVVYVQYGMKEVLKIKIIPESNTYEVLEEHEVRFLQGDMEYFFRYDKSYIGRMALVDNLLYFALRYTNSIEIMDTKITNVDFEENNIKNEKDLKELLNKSMIKNVSVFDIQGRLIKDFKACNSCLEKLEGIKGLKLVKVEQKDEIYFFKIAN